MIQAERAKSENDSAQSVMIKITNIRQSVGNPVEEGKEGL